MVVIIKRKHVKPPAKYDKEPIAFDLDEYSIRGYDPPDEQEGKGEDSAEELPPIYPTAWGWNSNGRSGNITADEVREPRYTQHSAGNRFIACAAGKHHSLLVCDDGKVYSFGDGRKGQLGYGNPFFDKPPKGGLVQVFPRVVNPSGCCKYNRDIKVTEVACGSTFSIAREGSDEDGVDLCPGLKALELSLDRLRKIFPDCHNVQYAWAQARQERAILSRSFGGKLVAWGTGAYGELGMGPYHKFSPYPQIIPKLDFVSIVKVSAGAHHVLAVSSTGVLYSWGMGRSGRLGHKNNADQPYPKEVQYFQLYHVETCAAGDAHSAVIMTKRRVNADGTHTRSLACFGRGAHGRLGVGHNRSISKPAIVTQWPPSFTSDYKLMQVACGGAHTLALAYREVPKTLANPYGIETYVSAWGFGTNGQLGVGNYLKDSFVPVKVRMPKWEIVCEVSAGRSWSLARTVAGELYSWGKGLRGQLGHGKRSFCIAPQKVETFASFLAISSQYAHNVSVTTTKRVLSAKNAEMFIDDIKRSKTVPGEDTLTIFKAAKKRVNMRLANHRSLSMRGFTCCRRDIHQSRALIRVKCVDCNLSAVCLECARMCHRGHTLVEVIYKSKSDIMFCKCGVFNSNCRVLPTMLEVNKESEEEQQSARGMVSIPEEVVDDDSNYVPRIYGPDVIKAVKCIQLLARSFIGKQQLRRMMKYVKYVRRTACENYYNGVIIKSIWKVIDRNYESYRIERENMDMQVEDESRKMYDFYHNLQVGLLGMDFLVKGIKKLFEKTCIRLPSQKDILELTPTTSQEKINAVATIPSFMYSVHTVKMIERFKHPTERIPTAAIVKMTRDFPRFDRHPGRYFDPDVCLLTDKFVRFPGREKQINDIIRQMDAYIEEIKEEEASGKKKKKEQPVVIPPQNLAPPVNRASATPPQGTPVKPPAPPGPSAPNIHPPPQPPGVPSAPVTGAPSLPSTGTISKSYVGRKNKTDKKEPVEPVKPTTVQGVKKLQESSILKLYRRHSIAGPEELYSRLQDMRVSMLRRSKFLRRNSVPPNVKCLLGDTAPTFSYTDSIYKSLDVFYARQVTMDEFLRKEYAYVWKKIKPKQKKHKMHVALKYAWCNPRLPIEMRRLVVAQGEPQRRHSIGEPERLSKQVHAMLETRNNLLKLRRRAAKREKIPVRRRSFDFGEIQDGEELINSILGYVFEEDFDPPTVHEIKMDNVKMERLMMETKFAEVDINTMIKVEPTQQNEMSAAYGSGEENIEVWYEYYDEGGYPYYTHATTGESVWEAPTGFNVHLYSQYQDTSTDEWYWYNNTTGESFAMTS